jgi:hypothetical protein
MRSLASHFHVGCDRIRPGDVDCGSTTSTQNYAAAISGLTFTNATSVFTPTTGVNCGNAITGNQVTASYPFPFLTSLISFNITLAAQACYPT